LAGSGAHQRASSETKKGMGGTFMKHNAWLRRHAVQLAAQLPEDTEQALAVLDFARILVETFLSGDQASSAGSTPRRLAISIVRPDEFPK
jgi:hypothetical protein